MLAVSRIRVVEEPFDGMQICTGMGKRRTCVRCGQPILEQFLARTIFGDGSKAHSHISCVSALWDEIGTVLPGEYGPDENPYRKYIQVPL